METEEVVVLDATIIMIAMTGRNYRSVVNVRVSMRIDMCIICNYFYFVFQNIIKQNI